MKQIKALLALLALTFGIGASAAGEGYTAGVENFDSLNAGELDVTTVRGDLKTSVWASWTAGEDQLTVTAYGDSATNKKTEATGTQANYLKIDTALNNGITFAANGLTETVEDSTYTYEPTPLMVTDSDQVYFDSLVNLSAGEADALAAVTMPDDGRLALWVQAVEVETEVQDGDGATKTETTEINQLCIRAGKITDEVTNNSNVYTAALDNVEAGWHRLTVRLFTNAARSGAAVPAMAIYLDGVAVAAANVDKPMDGAVLDRLTPKCKALATNNALFPSMIQVVSSTLGDVKGVQFSGSGSVDDLIFFTTARPSFITDDVNYFNLTWDENVTTISYTVNNGDAQTISDISTKSADIALAYDNQGNQVETVIAVTATYATGFGAGEWTATDASIIDGSTFTIEIGKYTPSGAIVSASTVATATATVTIGDDDATKLSATSLSDLITKISEALSEVTEDAEGSVYITLSDDQTVMLVQNEGDEFPQGSLWLGTSGAAGIVWTLDLNGYTITGAGEVGDSPIFGIDGTVVITDGSTGGTGSVNCGSLGGGMFENYGTLTINGGTFDCSAYNENSTGTFVFNGGKYRIADGEGNEYTAGDGTYLDFLNTNSSDDVTFAKEDGNDPKYYVVSDATPVETFTVTFVNAKAETSTKVSVESGKTVSAPDPEPTAENFIFLGWYLTTDGELDADAFDFENTKIVANITLTAKWAAVVAKIGEDGYATIQDALDAAVESANAENEVQVDIVADYTATFTSPMTLCGKGRDVTKITINVNEGVTIKNENREIGIMMIDNATVTFAGSGKWYKPNIDTTYKTATLFKIGETAVSDALAPADVIVNGGVFEADNANIFSIQNGTLTVNGGEFNEAYCGAGTYCIRADASGVKNSGGEEIEGGSAQVVVNGGTFTTTETPTVSPVGVNDGTPETADVKVYIPSTSTAKFKGNASVICGAMEDYLAVEETGTYDYTADYKFVKGTEDDYYTIKAIAWATVTVTWDEQVTSWSGTDDDETFPDADDDFDISKNTSYVNQYDVDDAVTCKITAYQFKDGYELDEEKSTLTVGPMTSGTETYTLHIAAKAVTPTYEPVDPESSTTCDNETTAKALADAINADGSTLINVPKELTDATAIANYRALFTATAAESTTESGKWMVTVDLKATATEAIKKVVDADTKALPVSTVAAATGDTTTKLADTTPGIYYSVVAGPTLGERKVRSCTMATGETLDVTLPHYDGAGFYQIEASVKAQTEE